MQPTRPTPEDLEMLSAYLDGHLTPSEREALEARLAQDSDLRAELQGLHETVVLLQALPRLKAPRNFTLDPAVYGNQERAKVLPISRRVIWGLGGMVAAAAALMLVIGVFFLSDSQNAAQQPSNDLALREVAQETAFSETASSVARNRDTVTTAIALIPTLNGAEATSVGMPTMLVASTAQTEFAEPYGTAGSNTQSETQPIQPGGEDGFASATEMAEGETAANALPPIAPPGPPSGSVEQTATTQALSAADGVTTGSGNTGGFAALTATPTPTRTPSSTPQATQTVTSSPVAPAVDAAESDEISQFLTPTPIRIAMTPSALPLLTEVANERPETISTQAAQEEAAAPSMTEPAESEDSLDDRTDREGNRVDLPWWLATGAVIIIAIVLLIWHLTRAG